ncbi:MAG: TetR/AcrR family transcriptional regulator [Chloroflexi bacterium]|nr:TetR/AcrR family transcriptional regulator [Chloroflexota bacterium]
MVRPKRTDQNTQLEEDIKATAWQQIHEQGAAALSLRGIARELGIAAPSIYHYFPTRDDLVTALIVEAFHALAETLRQARTAAAQEEAGGQLAALALAYRQWAVSYPQRYQLVFGTPIPGYVAPEAVTLPAATAGFIPLTGVLQAAWEADQLRVEQLAPLTPELKAMLAAWQKVEGHSDVEVLYLALTFWSRLHGLMTFEVNGLYPSFITDPGEVFRREIHTFIDHYLRKK